VSDAICVHVHAGETGLQYTVIEPRLSPAEENAIGRVKTLVFERAVRMRPKPGQAFEEALLEVYDGVATDGGSPAKLGLPPDRIPRIRYILVRDLARFGPLEALMRDPHIEDIQCAGTAPLHVIHKFFGMLQTNVQFQDLSALDAYVRSMSERVGRPVSDSRPIVDATLREGSRINMVYSDDVSRKGPSFSIRRAQEVPTTITRLISWKTLSPPMAAYLWLCLENNLSLFVCGEAACGKTVTLNALLSFVDSKAKVFSAEDTPEIRPPHAVWQRLLTRETGPDESRVRTFDLLRAALRSRPNYIVVGEIRGAEGTVAFQAMQTGHPTLATFHAENKAKMIQRLTTDPINIPVTFIDNLNVAVFQQATLQDGRIVRRVTAVDEIEGYSEWDHGVVTRPAFAYNPAEDRHAFKANNNSYILEEKIAAQHGYADPKEVYRELARRARLLEIMVERGIFDPETVNALIRTYVQRGPDAMPFPVV
jgi:archaeal flagellar protein FlaI